MTFAQPIGHWEMLRSRTSAALAKASPAVARRILGTRAAWLASAPHRVPEVITAPPEGGDGEGRHRALDSTPPKPAPVPEPSPKPYPMPKNPFDPRGIVRVVAGVAGVTLEQLIDKGRREWKFSHPRHLAILMISQRFKHLSTPQIGRIFGGMDHTSTLYGRRKAAQRLQNSITPTARWHRQALVAMGETE